MKNNKVRAWCSLLLAAAVFFTGVGLFSPHTQAVEDVRGTRVFTIGNPYATVDWDTWGAYKSNLHTHSTVSDGDVDFRDMIEAYYAAGYDILAMTDHGTVNYGWDVKPDVDILIGAANLFKKKNPLTTARKLEIYNGVGRNGGGMTEVPLGIELNGMSIKKTHVNGFYADSGHHVRAINEDDYEPCISKYELAGGITHINHIGDWADASGDPSVYDDPAMINYFKNIFLKYQSCLGFELVNTKDSRTRNDRILYDKLLKEVIPTGRNLFGFANDDAHELSDIGHSWNVFMMPQNTAANVRVAMETGTFFAVSKYARAELGNSFVGSGPAPGVTRITVDNDRAQIALEGENFTKVQWVADGVVIAEGASIDLNAYEDKISCYIRAQVSGPGGMCFVQPFPVTSETYEDATVTFVKNPAELAMNVFDAQGTVLTVNAFGSYDLAGGDYTFSAAADGFVPLTDVPFTVSLTDLLAGTKTIEVTLDPAPTLVSIPGSSTVIDHQKKYIYGLTQGLASLDNFAGITNNGTLRVTPTSYGWGTGTLVEVMLGDLVIETYRLVIKGDANGDGFADATDSTYAKMIVNGWSPADAIIRFACDANGDGQLDEIDCDILDLAGLFLYEIDQTK